MVEKSDGERRRRGGYRIVAVGTILVYIRALNQLHADILENRLSAQICRAIPNTKSLITALEDESFVSNGYKTGFSWGFLYLWTCSSAQCSVVSVFCFVCWINVSSLFKTDERWYITLAMVWLVCFPSTVFLVLVKIVGCSINNCANLFRVKFWNTA